MSKFPTLVCAVTLSAMCAAFGHAQDWDGIAVPAPAPAGMQWELQPISDSFNYQSTVGNRPTEFTSRWTDWFINPWTGPSLTQWERGHVWTNGSELGIQAHHDPNSNSILMGCMSSLDTFQYPLFMEARVRLADCTLANNVWMLSADSTEEIDIMETYPSSRSSSNWLDQRMHLSHHVFIGQPFQDYQPRDEEGVFGTWYYENGRSDWRNQWVRMGMNWVTPWHLEYYINGRLVRTIKKFEHSYLNPSGQLSEHTTAFDAIDKFNYTNGTGLSKPMHIIMNMEQQSWLTNLGTIPTENELDDANGQNTYFVDWIRVYKPEAQSFAVGDVNMDGAIDCADIDSYIGILGSNATANLAGLDLVTDGTIDSQDAAFLIENLVVTSNGETGTAPGDLNCDGQVDILGDAFILIANLNAAVTSYSDGDVDLGGSVTVLGDAFALIANLGFSNSP